jgi:hypothetical protein
MYEDLFILELIWARRFAEMNDRWETGFRGSPRSRNRYVRYRKRGRISEETGPVYLIAIYL